MTASLNPRDGWDFFLSYTQADKAWAEWIAWDLEEAGYKVRVQTWDFGPGSNWIQSMQAAVRDADRTIAVLSEAYLQSTYGSAEWQAAWASDPAGAGRKLLVVRISACERPGLLAGVVGVDLFGLTEPAARAKLRNMIASVVNGRSKPSVPPAFPAAKRMQPQEPRFSGTLPHVWRVLPRNPHFIGRRRELADLARGLGSGPRICVQAVRGMAGIGKTQLATEYAHVHAGKYDVVWQISSGEPSSLPGQFGALAMELNVDPATNKKALQAQVHDRLLTVSGWLLIFDNADEVEDIQEWLPSCPMPAGVPGHVIVTTRRGGFAALGQVMDLDVIGLSDALELLRTRVPGLDQEAGEQIAEELGRLPIALEQAADYMDRSQLPGCEYLTLLRTGVADVYMRGHLTHSKDAIATRWDSALKRIGGKSKAAVQLLDICAYLDPKTAIPLNLFTAHAELLPEHLSSAVRDPLAWNQTVAILIDHSMSKRSPFGLEFNPFVQAAVRARNDRRARKPTGSPLGVALGLLRAHAPSRINDAPNEWPRWEVLLPHVLAVIGHLDPIAEQPTSTAMADAAWLHGRAATYLQLHGRLVEAKTMMERALAMTEAACPPDHPEVANHLNNLATVLRDLGQSEAARPLMERALAIDQVAYGPEHPEVATDMNNLAASLRDLGQPDAARPLMECALAITEKKYGYDHPVVAIRLGNLAMILRDLEELEAAHSLQARALGIDETTYGPCHPAVVRSLNNLAIILYDMGQCKAARSLMRRALSITRAVYKERNSAAVATLNKLITTLQAMECSNTAWLTRERTLIPR